MAKAKKKSGGGAGLVALAAAGAAAAAAGYYFYGSKDAKKNRKIAAKWANDMKGDVLREAKKLKHIDRASLSKIVDKASATYKTVRSVDRGDLDRAVRELKSNLSELAVEAQGAVKSMQKGAATAVKRAKKTVKSAKKKVAKK